MCGDLNTLTVNTIEVLAPKISPVFRLGLASLLPQEKGMADVWMMPNKGSAVLNVLVV